VSVIIPTYNSSTTLLQALESVLNQTYKDLEVIVVDDGSTDDTRKTLELYINEKKITYLYQENQGCGVARNYGASIAKGEYLAFLDSDDYWHVEKLQKQIDEFAKNPSAVMCYTESYVIDPFQKLIWDVVRTSQGRPRTGKVLPFLIFNDFITLSSSMVKISTFKHVGGFVKEYDLMMFADYDLWLKLAPLGDFCFVPTPLMFYQTRAGSDKRAIKNNHKLVARIFLRHFLDSQFYLKGWYFIGWFMSRGKYIAYSFIV